MKKLLLVMMALLLLPCAAWAQELQTFYSAPLTYVINADGTVTITDCDWDTKGDLVIPDTIDGKAVTGIGEHAFELQRSLTSITLPDQLTTIGDGAFSHCKSLTSIVIPDGVTRIGDALFTFCESLTSVEMPENVTSIGDCAFYACYSMTSIAIADSVTSIGDSAFAGSDITELNVSPDHPVFAMVDGVLFDKRSGTLVVCPRDRTGVYAIPQGTTAIAAGAFHGCSGLTEITIPDSVTRIGDGAFIFCTMEEIVIPDSVTHIGGEAFSMCIDLSSIVIPDSVTSIGEYAFQFNTNLASVSIPDSVTHIGENAFLHCHENLILTVGRDSYAKQYAVDNGIAYTCFLPRK